MAEAIDHYARGAEFWRLIDEAEQRRSHEQVALFDTSTLTPQQKRRVWEHLQKRDPALAAMLQDAAVRDMRAMFDARVMLPRAMVREALDERS